MQLTPESIFTALTRIRQSAPVVHNITNYVVMNTTANALLAIGASPVMAHAEEEMRDMVSIAKALVVNIGTLSVPWIRAMHRAALKARELGIPVVFDPVGAGATAFRTETAREFIASIEPAIIRGNASEIMALLTDEAQTKGVDSLASSGQALDAARELSVGTGGAVCISGEVDYVVRGDDLITITGGHELMPRVTGMGCTASALCGAFAAVTPDICLAAAQAMAVMGIAGELAASQASGPGSLQVAFLDTLYSLNATTIGSVFKEAR